MLRELWISRKTFWYSAVGCLLVTLFVVISTYKISVEHHANIETYFYHFSITVFIQTISIFILISYIWRRDSGRGIKFFDVLAPTVFGVYLVHGAILAILRRHSYGFYPDIILPIVFYETITAFIISAGIVAGVQKAPFVRKIFSNLCYPCISQASRGTSYFNSSQLPGGGWCPGGKSGYQIRHLPGGGICPFGILAAEFG
jgi:surface polysaccharide O-acyltransferase-like enzyme